MGRHPDPEFLRRAIALATENVKLAKGGPFGAVIVREGRIVGEGANSVTASNDPTAHAEVNAIRAAARTLNTFTLSGSELYTSCEPCPMCLAAIYWARCERIFYGNSAADAADAGFDDSFLYDEMKKPLGERSTPIVRMCSDEAIENFKAWKQQAGRIEY